MATLPKPGAPPETRNPETVESFWWIIGVVGGVIFYSRFYVQWIASEIKHQSVMPVLFWYMSSVGSVLLFAFAVWSQSPLGALGMTFNIVVYARNLIHIWRRKGTLTPIVSFLVHATVAGIVLVAAILMLWTWLQEYERTSGAEQATATWIWLAIGLVGQALFAGRFLIQWLATEIKQRSVVPPVFWYLSVAAAFLQGICFAQRAEWVFAAGMAATIWIYGRNIWLIHRGNTVPAEA